MNHDLEKTKYSDIWLNFHKNYKSRAADPFALYIAKRVLPTDKILDVGCGDGSTAIRLRQAGFICSGIDITLDGLRKYNEGYIQDDFFEGTAWELPFEDNSFDIVVSTDLLEHIPPDFIIEAIDESIRVAKKEVYHCIASYNERPYCGHEVHLTVHPWDWWEDVFKRRLEMSGKDLKIKLLDRREFDKRVQKGDI